MKFGWCHIQAKGKSELIPHYLITFFLKKIWIEHITWLPFFFLITCLALLIFLKKLFPLSPPKKARNYIYRKISRFLGFVSFSCSLFMSSISSVPSGWWHPTNIESICCSVAEGAAARIVYSIWWAKLKIFLAARGSGWIGSCDEWAQMSWSFGQYESILV